MADLDQQVNSKLITYEQLAENFHLPINEVSKKLGICTTVLKKVCRRNGIPRWPYRKLKAIDKKISNLKTSLQKNPQESKRIHAEIVALQERKRLIMENPSCLSTDSTASNESSSTPTTFDEAYDDLNSSALLLSLTPNRDTSSPEPATTPKPTPSSSRRSPPKVPRLSFSAGRTEEEEEELLVASNLVELMSQHTFSSSAESTPFSSSSSAPILPSALTTPPSHNPLQQRPQTLSHLPPSFSSYTPTLFSSSHPPSPFSSSHPVPSFPSLAPTSPTPTLPRYPLSSRTATSSTTPIATTPTPTPTPTTTTTTTTRPSSTSPPPFPNMPIINPRSFFSPEERVPPIPHSHVPPPAVFQAQLSPTITPTQAPTQLRSFSSAPLIDSLVGDVEPQPPLPSWFSRSLEEAVAQNLTNSPQPQQPQQPDQHQQPIKEEKEQPKPKASPLLVSTKQQQQRPETPSGTKRAGRDVETLEAESRTQNSLTTKRSRNESPTLQALPSFMTSSLPTVPS